MYDIVILWVLAPVAVILTLVLVSMVERRTREESRMARLIRRYEVGPEGS